MWPVLFEYGDGAITTYAFLLGLAFVVGVGLWVLEASRFGLPGEKLVNLALQTFLVSLVGARLLFVIVRWPDFARGNYRVWALWEGGIVFYGGLLTGIAYLAWSLRRQKLPLAAAFNSIAPAMALAHGIGRVGCFANGCCYGELCNLPWAVTYTSPLTYAPKHLALHPVQLYEAFALFALAALLSWNNRRVKFGMPSWLLYLLFYAPLRFFLEFVRDDPERGSIGPFSTSQVFSLAVFCVSLFLAFQRRQGHNTPHESRYRESRRPQ